MSSRVVVVGGGLAGLTAAHRLITSRPGLDVLVVDGGDRPGGKVRRAEVGGVSLDVGAESVLASSAHAVQLCAELDLSERMVVPEPLAASIWTRGALRPIPTGTFMGVPGPDADLSGLLTEDEARRASAPVTGEPLETDRSIAEVVGGEYGSAVVDRVIEPLLGGVYAGRVEELSMQAAMSALWPAVTKGESLTSTVGRMLPPPPGADDPPRPSRLMGLDGGIVGLAERLVESITAAGGRVLTVTLVRGLERTTAGWRVVTGPTIAPEAHDADAVVLAVPATPAGRLLAPHAPAAGEALGAIPAASMAVLALALPRTPETTGLPGSGFLVPAVDGRTIKASTFASRKWAWVERESAAHDVVLLRASVGRAGEVEALQRDDEDLVRAAVAEIGDALGRPLPDPVDSVVQRWGGGLPQYTVGHRERVSSVRQAVAELPGLEVAGAVYDGVGIAAVLASADAAASATLETLAVDPPSTSHPVSSKESA